MSVVKDDIIEIASAASPPRNDGGGSTSSRNDGRGFRPFKPYYVAHTKIRTLALLDERYKGSNWSRWWRCRDSNPGPRTLTREYLHA